jgi:hypothetical protein
MIKRILDPEEFKKLADDIFDLHEFDNENEGHNFLLHDRKTIKNAFAHKMLLAWDVFVWANYENEKYDAVIIFLNDKNLKFNESIFSEFIWLSKNPKVGYKLFKEATKFAKEKGFKFISMNAVVKNKKYHSVKHFYEKMGFTKDSETYIAKL